jgi:hypothetical protein
MFVSIRLDMAKGITRLLGFAVMYWSAASVEVMCVAVPVGTMVVSGVG